MRDDTRSDPELISYLESENDYFQNWRDSNIDYESSIYKELKSMIPDEEETLRVKDGSFYYYSRIKASEQYSTYYRNSSNEEILLDVNKEAEGKEFYNVAGLNISPDENLLLYGEDLNGNNYLDRYERGDDIVSIRLTNEEAGNESGIFAQ